MMFLKENQTHLYFLHYKFNIFVCACFGEGTRVSFEMQAKSFWTSYLSAATKVSVRRRGEQFCTSNFILREPCKRRRLDIGKECGVFFSPTEKKGDWIAFQDCACQIHLCTRYFGKKKKKSEHQSIYKAETS
uniref:Uncharacterized protein n=1 Tax=Micrurus surinamensis TaxID=129470 RepID=A0A2D4PHU9_MICSU